MRERKADATPTTTLVPRELRTEHSLASHLNRKSRSTSPAPAPMYQRKEKPSQADGLKPAVNEKTVMRIRGIKNTRSTIAVKAARRRRPARSATRPRAPPPHAPPAPPGPLPRPGAPPPKKKRPPPPPTNPAPTTHRTATASVV